ncbi:hypothetical protein SAMD00019534_101480 [Acytostelium subglobosum LB1]|uniref:hypothetical protein n=1 Tax=Acytostelium subglobosum LB1 TaxID=1410327 RepID=UPI000644EFE4|nr:hypothetical protein SAMD00019534_101480 [Acytostelium subglobosum LB1]GAM26973.1 hypothetical protein SAMD00019534_101480 [Acytostelium subglobosum LB1]|eukprot:XP_012750241.1 hypothetical protein SAMD00019534_101480 [Acytostelium subglobosum LB1]
MSADSSTTRAIPFNMRDRDHINFSTSLGGTLYGTTPGGTKKVYDRSTMLHYRNSPLAKTPPPELATILEAVNRTATGGKSPRLQPVPNNNTVQQPESTAQKTASTAKPSIDEPEIFEMDA